MLYCFRMVKEVADYEKEAKDNEAKVQRMRDDEKDPYDIRKQEEVSPPLPDVRTAKAKTSYSCAENALR